MPQTEDVVTFLKVLGPFFELVTEEEAEEEERMNSAPKVNGHLVNGEVKMLENGVDEKGKVVWRASLQAGIQIPRLLLIMVWLCKFSHLVL